MGANIDLIEVDGKQVSKTSTGKRKFHNKSKNGCDNCKKRRVKCDEGKPECQKCRNMNLNCVYSPPKPRIRKAKDHEEHLEDQLTQRSVQLSVGNKPSQRAAATSKAASGTAHGTRNTRNASHIPQVSQQVVSGMHQSMNSASGIQAHLPTHMKASSIEQALSESAPASDSSYSEEVDSADAPEILSQLMNSGSTPSVAKTEEEDVHPLEQMARNQFGSAMVDMFKSKMGPDMLAQIGKQLEGGKLGGLVSPAMFTNGLGMAGSGSASGSTPTMRNVDPATFAPNANLSSDNSGGRVRGTTLPAAAVTSKSSLPDDSGCIPELSKMGFDLSKMGVFPSMGGISYGMSPNKQPELSPIQEKVPVQTPSHSLLPMSPVSEPPVPTKPNEGPLNLQDLRIFYHYTTKVWPTITNAGISEDKIWNEEIPKLAFNYPFLMHAILAFAATHLSRTEEGLEQYVAQHRLEALRLLREAVLEISDANTDALVASALILIMDSLANAAQPSTGTSLPSSLSPSAWIFHVKGAATILTAVWPLKETSRFYNLISVDLSDLGDIINQESGTVTELVCFDESIADLYPVEVDSPYLITLAYLDKLQREKNYSNFILRVFAFPALLDKTFLALLMTGDTSAMRIMRSYYFLLRGFATEMKDKIWFLEGVSQVLPADVEEYSGGGGMHMMLDFLGGGLPSMTTTNLEPGLNDFM